MRINNAGGSSHSNNANCIGNQQQQQQQVQPQNNKLDTGSDNKRKCSGAAAGLNCSRMGQELLVQRSCGVELVEGRAHCHWILKF